MQAGESEKSSSSLNTGDERRRRRRTTSGRQRSGGASVASIPDEVTNEARKKAIARQQPFLFEIWETCRNRFIPSILLSKDGVRWRRLVALLGIFLLVKVFLLDRAPATPPGEIQHPALLERIALNAPLISNRALDSRNHDYLQQRIGRDNRPDLFIGDIKAGVADFWHRFQLPFATNAETVHLDEQVIKGVVEDLMGFNGWAAAECSSLTRPFSNAAETHEEMGANGGVYYFALVLHSADHFLIDQLAAIVQISRRLQPSNMFVSIVDYGSTDATPFLCDLTEMVFVLLNIPFKIQRVDLLHQDSKAAYYPMEEAYTRNLALEPLQELYSRRRLRFSRVIWLKGFTCPNDILETLRISHANSAALICGMDWKEHNGIAIFNDRWRSRDMNGEIFRGSKSTANAADAPPRDTLGMARYAQHLPFQAFCCDSGMHIVDPAQTYYVGLTYRSSVAYGVFNVSESVDNAPKWADGPCMDSSQLHFCRDIWMHAALTGVQNMAKEAANKEKHGRPRDLSEEWESLIRAVGHEHSKNIKQAAFPEELLLSPLENANKEADAFADPHSELTPDELAADRKKVAAADMAAAALPIDVPVDEILERRQKRALPEERAEKKRGKKMARKPGRKGKEAKDALADADKEPPLSDEETEEAADYVEVGENERQASQKSKTRRKAAALPNSAFSPARILVNPRCVTTYAGVSHAKLATDLFGRGEDAEASAKTGGRYTLDDTEWQPAPEMFVCQEMRTTGGRTAPKQQRRIGFYISRALQGGWHAGHASHA